MSVTRDKSFTELEGVMSNSDHSIEEDVAKQLKTGKYYSQYSGWNFCGYVWWEKPMWSCEVWTYNYHTETVHGQTLQEIMDIVSQKYGYD